MIISILKILYHRWYQLVREYQLNDSNWWTPEMERVSEKRLKIILKNLKYSPSLLAVSNLNKKRLERKKIAVFPLGVQESNDYVKNLITANEQFSIIRTGNQGGEITSTYNMIRNENISRETLNALEINAGIYGLEDKKKLSKFCELYNNAIKNCNAIISWENKHDNYFSQIHKLKTLQRGCGMILNYFEANICCESDLFSLQNPWTLDLYGKKVLLINPFTESIKNQLNNGFRFSNRHLFSKDQKFLFYKSFNTIAGNRLHSDWEETFNIMCSDISKMKFDIALLGCGGYGLPLCEFIRKDLNKGAIYIGGQLQLFFGITGRRWTSEKSFKERMDFNIDNFGDFKQVMTSEKVNNYKQVENGCYF